MVEGARWTWRKKRADEYIDWMFYKMLTGASGRIGALIDQLPSVCRVPRLACPARLRWLCRPVCTAPHTLRALRPASARRCFAMRRLPARAPAGGRLPGRGGLWLPAGLAPWPSSSFAETRDGPRWPPLRSAPWVEPKTLNLPTWCCRGALSRGRLQERGFNQAALLARHIAGSRVDTALLLRLRATEAQSGLPRSQRLRNLLGAFAVELHRAAAMQGRRIVLVDDVMTTGATLNAAAHALREAGCCAHHGHGGGAHGSGLKPLFTTALHHARMSERQYGACFISFWSNPKSRPTPAT